MALPAYFSRVGWYRSSVLAALSVACASEPDAPQPDEGATGGVSATSGSAGTGGKAPTSGAGGVGGVQANSGTGGSSGSSSTAGGSAGKMTTGGTSSGSSGAGGVAGGGGNAGGSGGTLAGGASGGAPLAGGAGMAGSLGLSGLGGAAGAGGSGGSSAIASALDGLRVDAPCAGTPTLENGDVCNHVSLTSAGGFYSEKEVMIEGTPGTTYEVTLRIRGVVEPTNIGDGTRPNTATFQYMNMPFRTVPLTFGGTVQSPDYAQWHIRVESPAADVYLNDYQKTGHYIFELDYEVTLPMDANTQVTLDATDSNERQIVNYEGYALDGIPGSMNHGQFVQINVVSVVPRAD